MIEELTASKSLNQELLLDDFVVFFFLFSLVIGIETDGVLQASPRVCT